MKDYKEITESLFKRRDKYLEEQKKKKVKKSILLKNSKMAQKQPFLPQKSLFFRIFQKNAISVMQMKIYLVKRHSSVPLMYPLFH